MFNLLAFRGEYEDGVDEAELVEANFNNEVDLGVD
jgi:hypothetical protein